MKNLYLNKLLELQSMDYVSIYKKMLLIKEIVDNIDFISFNWQKHFNNNFQYLKDSINNLSNDNNILDTDIPTYQNVIYIFQFLGYVYKFKLN